MAAIIVLMMFLFLVRLTTGHSISSLDYLDAEKCADKYDIARIIPFNDIFKDVLIAYRFDPEIKAAFNYLNSDEYNDKTQKLASRPEYQSFREYLINSNLRILEAERFLKVILPTVAMQAEITDTEGINPDEIIGGVHGLLMRILDKRLPLDVIRNSFKDRFACDAKYKEKLDSLRSTEFKYLLAQLRATPEYKELIQDMEDQKIYLDVYLNVLLDYINIDL